METRDHRADPGEDDAASITLFAYYEGDEFPYFEVITEGLASQPAAEDQFEPADVTNDPLAKTSVSVQGPMRHEKDGSITWGLPDSNMNTSLAFHLPGREGIEIDQAKVEVAATILANALRDGIRAGLFE